jgi:hypothetical protein
LDEFSSVNCIIKEIYLHIFAAYATIEIRGGSTLNWERRQFEPFDQATTMLLSKRKENKEMTHTCVIGQKSGAQCSLPREPLSVSASSTRGEETGKAKESSESLL